MLAAEVGDHVLGDDPTAAELESYVAELLGHERALFFPSGTMANQTALLVQAEPGTEVWTDRAAHIVAYEEAAAAALAGVQIRTLPDAGIAGAEAFRNVMPPDSPFTPRASLIGLENTHNGTGGKVLPLETMREVVALARERGLRVHLDGARLANASVATGRAMREWASLADTAMISLSKGLGAPVGSLLAGSAEVMERAWRARRRLGGGMRQVGILAAAGLYALRNNIDRLAEDHERIRRIAASAAGLPGLAIVEPETNMLLIGVGGPATSADLVAALAERGVAATPFGRSHVRLVTHLDIGDEDVEHVIRALREAAAALQLGPAHGLRSGGDSS